MTLPETLGARTSSTVELAMTQEIGGPLRVVIAEDNYLVREGAARLLAVHPGVHVAAAVSDLPSLLSAVQASPPDAVLTDIRMPPTQTDEGIRAAQELQRTHPDVGVVVLSQHLEPAFALALFDTGAARRAYLLKDRLGDSAQLVHALFEVARGGSVVDPLVIEAMVGARMARHDDPLIHLTVREREVLAAMAEGRTNAAIAAVLGLSERMVEKYSNSLFAKLGVSEERDVHRRVKAVLLYLGA